MNRSPARDTSAVVVTSSGPATVTSTLRRRTGAEISARRRPRRSPRDAFVASAQAARAGLAVISSKLTGSSFRLSGARFGSDSGSLAEYLLTSAPCASPSDVATGVSVSRVTTSPGWDVKGGANRAGNTDELFTPRLGPKLENWNP